MNCAPKELWLPSTRRRRFLPQLWAPDRGTIAHKQPADGGVCPARIETMAPATLLLCSATWLCSVRMAARRFCNVLSVRAISFRTLSIRCRISGGYLNLAQLAAWSSRSPALRQERELLVDQVGTVR